jgi:hypothetical protein
MSTSYKILGQHYVGLTEVPGGGGGGGSGYYYGLGGTSVGGTYIDETLLPYTLYTVPVGKHTVVSSVFVTNHDIVERTYDLAIVPDGETLSLKHHVRWDYPVGGNDFDIVDDKFTLAAGDKIIVLPSSADKVGFTAFGVEIEI